MVEKEENVENQGSYDLDDSREETLDASSQDDLDLLERIKSKVNKQGWFSDLKICFVVLTRLPVYIGISPEDFSISEASRFFPIVGAVIGLLSALVVWFGGWFGFSGNLLAENSLFACNLG